MKTEQEWDQILNELYWNVEYGEHRLAIKKLMQFETDAYRAGMTRAAEICERNQYGQGFGLRRAITEARDAITTLD